MRLAHAITRVSVGGAGTRVSTLGPSHHTAEQSARKNRLPAVVTETVVRWSWPTALIHSSLLDQARVNLTWDWSPFCPGL